MDHKIVIYGYITSKRGSPDEKKIYIYIHVQLDEIYEKTFLIQILNLFITFDWIDGFSKFKNSQKAGCEDQPLNNIVGPKLKLPERNLKYFQKI